MATTWTLWRQDIYGNEYRMPMRFADREEALAAEADFTARGHHQTYFVREMDITDGTSFIAANDAERPHRPD